MLPLRSLGPISSCLIPQKAFNVDYQPNTPPEKKIWHINTCIAPQKHQQIREVIHTTMSLILGLADSNAKHNALNYFIPSQHANLAQSISFSNLFVGCAFEEFSTHIWYDSLFPVNALLPC